ncbi:co-chaperone YbbN [Thiosulfatimonas sediminis]|uniref:Co-chaperone YbbN n=1 Tax=Thiosulfatimonas sediminis TaxID=2675054 RepID=A0A6F8PVM1_9GAMM|nr:tetratricopeptide repeat protein [Thiosulfatimonas sediminis]BBP46020.1 co-chaperone YbbN [Thiosulfatimonas sediminis]
MSDALTVTLENFHQSVIDNSEKLPVLVDFWAPWCNPCQQIMPMLEQLAQALKGRFILAKINTEEQCQLAEHFHVQSLPTFKICYKGKIVESIEGVHPSGKFVELLEKYMPADESENLRQKALVDLQLGDYESALQQLVAASQVNPNNFKIHLDIVKVYIAQGEIDNAKTLAQRLPEDIRHSPEIKALMDNIKYIEIANSAPPMADILERLATEPNDPEMLYALAMHQLAKNESAAAMQTLLHLFSNHREFGDDVARKTLLELFENRKHSETDLVNQYRRKLQNLLF